MLQRTYLTFLSVILFVVVASMYMQYRTFGSNQYWIFVVIIVLGWMASRWLVKAQTGSYKNTQIDWKEVNKLNPFKRRK